MGVQYDGASAAWSTTGLSLTGERAYSSDSSTSIQVPAPQRYAVLRPGDQLRALFFPRIPCALCGCAIDEPDSWIGFAALQSRPPSSFDDLSDACVHQRCLISWKSKDAFVVHYNLLVNEEAGGKVSRLVIRPGGDVVHEVDDWSFDRTA